MTILDKIVLKLLPKNRHLISLETSEVIYYSDFVMFKIFQMINIILENKCYSIIKAIFDTYSYQACMTQ